MTAKGRPHKRWLRNPARMASGLMIDFRHQSNLMEAHCLFAIIKCAREGQTIISAPERSSVHCVNAHMKGERRKGRLGPSHRRQACSSSEQRTDTTWESKTAGWTSGKGGITKPTGGAHA